MNREQKLSLIIGFSLILLVGVLISDHLSGARTATISTVDADEANLFGAQPAQVDVDAAPFTLDGPLPGDGPPAVAIENNPTAIALGPQGASGTGALFRSVQESAGETAPFAVIDQSPGASPAGGPTGGLLSEIARRGGTIVDQGIDTVFNLPLANAEHAAQTYTVAAGDTLWAIAQRYYGQGAQWPRIAEANNLASGAALRVGMVLHIRGALVVADGGERAGESAPAARTYTVRTNDTIGEIALALLGTSHRWPEIASLNGIENENMVYAGQVLKIPSQ